MQLNGSGAEISNISVFSNSTDGIEVQAGYLSISNVMAYSNGGHGVIANPAGGDTIVNVRSYGNTGIGLVIQSADVMCTNIYAATNGGGGISIAGGLGGIMLSAKLVQNTGAQLILGEPSLGNMIDAVIFTAAGQTAYSGTLGNSFYRIATAGADIRPVNQAQV